MSWTRRPERGSQWLMRFMARLTLGAFQIEGF